MELPACAGAGRNVASLPGQTEGWRSLLACSPLATSFAAGKTAPDRFATAAPAPRLGIRMRARPALLAALLSAPATAGAQAAGFGPIVLQLPVSTRAIGFGNAYVAVREPESFFYNPAQLGVRPGVALSVERYGSVATAGAIASTYVFGPIGFGVGAQFLD